MKLDKNKYPTGHGPEDFRCFGPPALRDGDFDACMIADLGFFSQEDKDSAKYYHGAVVQSKTTDEWFAYFEWGRTGAKSISFQFFGAISKEDAQLQFAEQMHSKNDKRGVWTTVGGVRTLSCKPGKDCYLVRPLATRVTGLPDAKTIKSMDGADQSKLPSPVAAKKRGPTPKADPLTIKLLRDLGHGTVQFTRSSMADASLPTQRAIDEARQLLDAATERVGVVGGKIDDQVNDRDLVDITGLLYKRIPKVKARNAPAATWILSFDNIGKWREDLDAFEAALYTTADSDFADGDPYDGMNIEMEWVPQDSPVGVFLNSWWPNATRNRHSNMGDMEIVNAWTVQQKDGLKPFASALEKVVADKVEWRPYHQPKTRDDIDESERPLFERAHVMLGLHGTRSVNVSGILRKRLLLPKKLKGVEINGALLGPGLYWADDIKKSCQYVSLPQAVWSKGSGSIPGRSAFMFVADVILGNPHRVDRGGGFTSPPKGYHSMFAQGGHTASRYGTLENNEWVVYDEGQHRIRYLVEFKEREGTRGRPQRRWT